MEKKYLSVIMKSVATLIVMLAAYYMQNSREFFIQISSYGMDKFLLRALPFLLITCIWTFSAFNYHNVKIGLISLVLLAIICVIVNVLVFRTTALVFFEDSYSMEFLGVALVFIVKDLSKTKK